MPTPHHPQADERRHQPYPSVASVLIVAASDPQLPVLFDRSTVVGAGMSLGQLHRRVAAGRWSRVRWGHYVGSDLGDELRWRAQILATVRAHQRPLVLSHAHAARA